MAIKMTLSAVKHFSKFRWFLFLSFSTVLLIFLFKELSLNSSSSSTFDSLLRQLASRVPVHWLGSPAKYDALKSLVDLLTGLQSPLSETDLCISRKKPKDDVDSKVANGVQRNLKVTIARTTDTFALDLETSILPKKRKKEKSLNKLELGNVTVAESAGEPKNDQNESPEIKADNGTNEKILDSGVTASSLEPSKESFVNHSSPQRDPSLGVNDIDRSLSIGSKTAVVMNASDLKQSFGVTVGSKMMKAVNPTKMNQKNLMKSNSIETESIEMIDVSSIKAIDFTEKNTAVDLKSENTTILGNQGIQDPKSVEKQLFFMYDLDEKFWWRCPKPETDCR